MRRFPGKKLLFAAVALALFFGLAEITARVTGWGQDPAERFFADLYDPIPRLVAGARNPYEAAAEFLSDQGLRGPKFADRKTPGVFRIVCLGDSQTFGAGTYADSYPAQLQRLLDDEAGAGRFEVINAGIHGTNLYQQRLFFEDFFADKNLDLLLVMSGPNCRADLQAYRNHSRRFAYRLADRSHRALAHVALYRSLRGVLKGGTQVHVLDDSQIYVGGQCDRGEYRRDYEADLTALLTLGRRRGFDVAFVTPSNQASIGRLVMAGADPDAADFFTDAVAAHHDSFQPEFAARHAIAFIQVWGDFVRHADDQRGLWHDPDHANSFGNELIARRIVQDLRALKLIPPQAPSAG